ncbi:MAG: glutaredoxin domain-containing protein [Chloroherpetonaceae bacterium]|nr:glutaredoxin domain-containing protein [Chloroherpetonaceae bacterium]
MDRKVTMYTTSWCPDCHRTERILKDKSIHFEKIDIEKLPEAAEIVMSITGGKRSVPTLVIEDSTGKKALVNPNPNILSKELQFEL